MKRAAVAGLLLALSLPTAAYLPPTPAILKRVALRRAELRLASLEARGTIAFTGEAADRARAAIGMAPSSGDLTSPALLLVKMPGRCRLDLASAGVPASQRPSVSERSAYVTGHRGLDSVAAARALVEGVCTLLAWRSGGEPDHGLGQYLATRGIDLREVALGRLDGHVAWVIGGHPASARPPAGSGVADSQEARPQAWFDKETFQPVRIIAAFGGARRDVRLLGFGAGPGRDLFPRTVEVWADGHLEARFSTEQVTPNPRLPDAIF